MEISWSDEKNRKLKSERGLAFEDVVAAIENGRVLADIDHHPAGRKDHQRILVVEIDGYACVVPYVEQDAVKFLTTIYYSRDAEEIFGEQMTKSKRLGVEQQILDNEERDIEAALQRGEFTERVPRIKALKEWQQAVRNTLRKKPITVRVQEQDIARIKAKALEQGIPYQTLVASILHRYAKGTLKEEI